MRRYATRIQRLHELSRDSDVKPTVLVQSVAGRASWSLAQESIEASDIGKDYGVSLNPPDMTARQHFVSVLQQLSLASTPIAIRLEDDCIVNKYLLHNVLSWEDIEETDFGVGWLFSPIPFAGRWPRAEFSGAIGLVFRTEHLPELVQQVEQWYEENPSKIGKGHDDLAISHAVWRAGRRIYVHDPSLVEHQWDTPSMSGNHYTVETGTTNGRFSPEWKALG